MKIAFAIISFFFLSFLSHSQDLDQIKSNLKNDTRHFSCSGIVYTNKNEVLSIDEILNLTNVNGSFNSIDYSCISTAKRSLNYIQVLISSYNCASSPYFNDNMVLSKSVDALKYYLDNVPRPDENACDDSFFVKEIASNILLGPIAIILEDLLTPEYVEKVYLRITDMLNEGETHQGTNRMWRATLMIYRSVLENDDALLGVAVQDGIKSLLQFQPHKAGIQVDWSYHQHNELNGSMDKIKGQIYSTEGYGKSFLEDMTWLIGILDGSSHAFLQSEINMLGNLITNGTRWFLRNEFVDLGTMGRALVREDISSEFIIEPINRLIGKVNPAIANDLLVIKSHIEGGSNPIEGNKHFWYSDFMTHHRNGYYASVKMNSNRVKGTENINNENIKGHWLPDGTCLVTKDGTEYHNIQPLWNWHNLPGVTNPETDALVAAEHNLFPQRSLFVGGVSDGDYGVSGMKLSIFRNDVSKDLLGHFKAKKSLFFFDNEIVALGNSVSHEGNDLNLGYPGGIPHTKTTINQTLVQGPRFEGALPNHKWFWHDDIGYIAKEISGQNIEDTAVFVSSNWNVIGGRNEAISDSIMTIGIDHGLAPSDAKYEYAIFPDISKESLSSMVNLPYKVLENNADVQAVYHYSLNRVGAVFYSPGTVSTPEQISNITTNHPCILMFGETSDDLWTLSVADPDIPVDRNTYSPPEIVITLKGNFDGNGAIWNPHNNTTDVYVQLNSGYEAGRTSVIELKKLTTWIKVPSHDSYVRSGNYQNDNFGDKTRLVVKNSTGDNDRRSYLKFDLEGEVPSSVDSVIFTIDLMNLDAASADLEIIATDPYWEENRVFYNQHPSHESEMMNLTLTSEGVQRINITDIAISSIEKYGVVSFAIQSRSSGYVEFSSKEGGVIPRIGLYKRDYDLVEVMSDTVLLDEDTYVRGGIYETDNFGSHSTLVVKNSSLDYERMTYLKSILNSIEPNAEIMEATLSLSAKSVENGGGSVSVYGTHDLWNANSVIHLTKPHPEHLLVFDAFINNANQVYNFDVTSYVKSQFESDQSASFCVTQDIGNALLSFYSLESSSSKKPKIILKYYLNNGGSGYRELHPSLAGRTNDLVLFPNPVQNILRINNLVGATSVSIDIYSINGQLSLSYDDVKVSENQVLISVFDLSKGLYIVNVVDDLENSEMVRLLKE